MKCGFDVESNDMDLIDSADNGEIVDSLIGGDVLTVYCQDENRDRVDHVPVSQASLLPNIEVTNHVVPGSDSYMQIHCDDDPIDQSGISYAINEDLSITCLSDLEAGTSLFGSYVLSEEGADDAPIALSYLFSFNPSA